MKRALGDIAILMVLAWASLSFSLFGTSDRADKYVQDVINTHFGDVLYPYPPHDDITVLLLTDHALNTEELQGRWPVQYDFHGRVLKAVLTHQPKAVFIDFMWLSRRAPAQDDGFQDGNFLKKQLNDYKKAGIPVYLAASQAVRNNWPDLEGLVEWVSVPLGFDVSDFVARRYPAEALGLPTAAFRIAQAHCDHCVLRGQEQPTMDIVWSAQLNAQNHAWMQPDSDPHRPSLQEVLFQGYSGISLATPFSTTLFVRDLLKPVAESPEMVYAHQQRYLRNKIVLYGANLQGVNDLVFTPARTLQPGVYFHAMALDNLLNWGHAYKSEEGSGQLSHHWISMLAILPIAVLCVLLHHTATERLTRFPVLQQLVGWGKAHPVWRACLISIGLILWFGSVALIEFHYFNYSASVVMGYLQVIMIGFFVERTAVLDKLEHGGKQTLLWLRDSRLLKKGEKQ